MIPKRRGRRKKRVCQFCVDKVTTIDYKDIAKLRKFVSERGKILPRRVSGNCAKHQRAMTMNVKRARHMALMVYTQE
jgi:small subunit ribosomal protein S18